MLSVRANSVWTVSQVYNKLRSHCGVEAQATGLQRRHAVKKHRPTNILLLNSTLYKRQIQTGLDNKYLTTPIHATGHTGHQPSLLPRRASRMCKHEVPINAFTPQSNDQTRT
ncbi:hypothetical protein N7504_007722 [Penicillium tannophilum]|nr:hypothetical protein N7504_007722 [Penicillium tannophilum]